VLVAVESMDREARLYKVEVDSAGISDGVLSMNGWQAVCCVLYASHSLSPIG